MAQAGGPQMVPDQITGAATTDFNLYVGACKGDKQGNQYVLVANQETVSVPQGAGMISAA